VPINRSEPAAQGAYLATGHFRNGILPGNRRLVVGTDDKRAAAECFGAVRALNWMARAQWLPLVATGTRADFSNVEAVRRLIQLHAKPKLQIAPLYGTSEQAHWCLQCRDCSSNTKVDHNHDATVRRHVFQSNNASMNSDHPGSAD
jgi:hypothetical protein